MDKMIAVCGLVCTECPAYLATRRDDDALRAKTAATWSQMFHADIKPEQINCDGCLSEGGRLFSHCHVCDIRKCGREHAVLNCAYCDGYGCERIVAFIEMAPQAKRTLESIRQNL